MWWRQQLIAIIHNCTWDRSLKITSTVLKRWNFTKDLAPALVNKSGSCFLLVLRPDASASVVVIINWSPIRRPSLLLSQCIFQSWWEKSTLTSSADRSLSLPSLQCEDTLDIAWSVDCRGRLTVTSGERPKGDLIKMMRERAKTNSKEGCQLRETSKYMVKSGQDQPGSSSGENLGQQIASQTHTCAEEHTDFCRFALLLKVKTSGSAQEIADFQGKLKKIPRLCLSSASMSVWFPKSFPLVTCPEFPPK